MAQKRRMWRCVVAVYRWVEGDLRDQTTAHSAVGLAVLRRFTCSLAGLAAPADSVLPSLAYGSSCSSTVVIQNLTDTAVDVELEAHRSSGALVPLAGLAGRMIHLAPGE